MKRPLPFLALIAFCTACSTAYALYSVSNEGEWPKTWPKELEPLRKQARTYVGPTLPQPHHAISFTKREDFEAAWPQILKVKSKGAPIFLRRGPLFFGEMNAGVCVHCPPPQSAGHVQPEKPVSGYDIKNPSCWMFTNYIDLVVDGEIVDLNRIPLPDDTPIIDERFQDKNKTMQPTK